MKVQNDILLCIDEQKVVLMALLDLSAAFDTCNQHILLSRLETQFHVSGSALTWFSSYLNNRSQRVKIKDSLSDPVKLVTGFPQGSGWGPRLFKVRWSSGGSTPPLTCPLVTYSPMTSSLHP